MMHLSRMFFLPLALLTFVGACPANAAFFTECNVIDGISGITGQKSPARVFLRTGELVISGEEKTIWDGTYQYSGQLPFENSTLFQQGGMSLYLQDGVSVVLGKVRTGIGKSYEAYLSIGPDVEGDPRVAERFLLSCQDSE